MSATYKKIDLFGNEQVHLVQNLKGKKPNLFTHYDTFVDKFEPKKTTDDCYTPADVYDLVLNYVRSKCNIEGMEILRPFYPGGDFEAIDYSAKCVVIDNPPFSIISKIAKYYTKHQIPFFLFAPHLTLFGPDIDCTHIVVGGDITYENGATVKTSFLSNLFDDAKIIGDAELSKAFKRLNNGKKVNLPKYEYPDHVVTVSQITWIIERGITIQIDKMHAKHWRALASQKAHGKGIFGSGFLLSEKAAAEKAAAEKAAAEKAAAEKENVINWEISASEWQIIRSLGQTQTTTK